MKNLIKRAQSQACLGFAERKNFRPLAKLKKLTLTLVALLSMATGAWALPENDVTVTPVTGKTNQWTFKMPAGNVELTPIYAPEFTATFKAGNANTIQDGKATVTVTESGATEGTDVTANIGTDGKLTPLYEGQTITMTAAPGYKFRTVEVKKVDPAKAYLKWNSTQKKLVATEIPAEVTTVQNADQNVEWAAGTYVVEGEITIGGKITLNGDVELIIKDGAKLTVNYINGSSSKYDLKIYGQANQTGQLVVNSSVNSAIFNITTLAVHSCQVTATSSGDDKGGFNNIKTFNVYGGSVDGENTGSSGFGIWLDFSGSMNIYGGDVKAVGKGSKYGIDSTGSASVIVYGGKLWAGNADQSAFYSYVPLTKGAGFTGKIEYSSDNSTWSETVDASAKYVRVGY